MPTTRSATRSGSSAAASPASSQSKPNTGAGTKRKAETTPSKAKRGKKNDKKEQATIDDTMDLDKLPGTGPKREGPDPNDTIVDSDEEDAKAEEKAKQLEKEEKKAAEKTADNAAEEEDADASANGHANGTAASTNKDASESKPETEKLSAAEKGHLIKAAEKAEKDARSKHTGNDGGNKHERPSEKDATTNGNTEQVNKAVERDLQKAEPEKAVEQDSERAKAEPSNILEKGIIYFFFRGRVGLDDPSSVDEVQRSYLILRPVPSGGKLADAAPIGDAGKNRIIALPKKVLPGSRRDTFLCFVEAADASFDAIREEHLKKSDYETKTMGTRHTPAAKPVAEGIYALTTTGRESHLSYILTVPSELGEVQRDIGLTSRGAFITSVKNPDAPAAPGTAPPQTAEYPEGVKKDFRALRWGRLEPAHLDHVDTQFLLIGEGEQDKLEKAVQVDKGDGADEGKEAPLEELELLSKEDHERISGLSGDDSDAIFKDLGLQKDEYAKIQTAWE